MLDKSATLKQPFSMKTIKPHTISSNNLCTYQLAGQLDAACCPVPLSIIISLLRVMLPFLHEFRRCIIQHFVNIVNTLSYLCVISFSCLYVFNPFLKGGSPG